MPQQTLWTAGSYGRSLVRVIRTAEGDLWLDWREQGRRRRRKLPHRDVKRAREEATRISVTLFHQQPPSGARLRVCALITAYLTLRTAAKSSRGQQRDPVILDRWRTVLAHDPWPEELTQTDVERYVTHRRSEDASIRNTTIRKECVLLRAVLNWGCEQGHCTRNSLRVAWFPVPEQPRQVLMTDEWYAKLQEANLGHPARGVFLQLAHEVGGRRRALCHLRWSHVDLVTRELTFHRTSSKTQYEFRVPLSAVAVQALEQYRPLCPSPVWVFPSPQNPAKPMSVHLAGLWFKRLVKRAKLEVPTLTGWHSFRRKLVTDLKTELSVKDLQELGGWKDPRMVLVYMQADRRAQRAALDRRTGSRSPVGH